ncbi:MAG: response regulator [Candidatus Thermoplasmatota archaeon]|nr:response regulator [Candidatus Thermoplasmatota archaeon]
MRRILIVDDETDQVFGIKTALEETYGDKYQVITAESGKKCFEILEGEEKPDIILLDIMMPEMSGWEVFDKLKDNPQWQSIPIVFLTARIDHIAKKAGEFLAEDYIEKPVDIQVLNDRIEKVFATHALSI